MKRLIALLLLIPVLASADPEPWMKSKNPNDLGAFAYVSRHCPMSERELLEIVEGVITQLGLKFVHPNSFSVHIVVSLQCADISSKKHTIANYSLNFSRKFPYEYSFGSFVRLGHQNAGGSLYYGPLSKIRQWIATDTDDVVADYILANLDAGDSDD